MNFIELERMLVHRSSQLSEQPEAGPLFSYLEKLKVTNHFEIPTPIVTPHALHSSLAPH